VSIMSSSDRLEGGSTTSLAGEYYRLLRVYWDDQEEEALFGVAELAKRMVSLGLGPEVLVDVHTEAMAKVFSLREYELTIARLDGANRVLVNAMMACALSYYGLVSQLERQAQLLSRMNEDLQMATEAKDRFLASMSHELRTPLNSILGFTGVVLSGAAGGLTDEQSKQLHMVKVSGTRLLALINDILDLAKIESGKVTVHVAEVSVPDLVMPVMDQLRPLAEQKGLGFELRIPARAGVLCTDADDVRRVLTNLLVNAIKYTECGSVRLEVESRGDAVAFHVADTGVGIPSDALEYIFDEFRQMEGPTHAETNRTGLGLAICRQLALLLCARIEVCSEPGVGSTFTFTVPRSVSDADGGKRTGTLELPVS
jgi:signal transduction histidine kinase